MAKYGNTSSVPLSIAVFLATDSYDYRDDPNHLSVTSLLRPARQVILSQRVPQDEGLIDLMQMMPNRIGAAIHNAVEQAWKRNHLQALKDLGYPDRVIQQVVVNPEPGTPLEGKIPVYLERRAERQVGPYIVSGKFDFVGDGRVEDVKTTSVFTWMNSTNDDQYTWQGSMYRWLNPDIITKDHMAIQFIFTDWSKLRAMQDPRYPQARHQEKVFPLKSVQETEAFVKRKIDLVMSLKNTPEPQLPLCNDAELWRAEPVFKYYKNPEKTQRSTKNFETMQEARIRFIEDGSIGLIKEVPGQVTACKYCPAFPICTQKDDLIASGDLVLSS
jgi:hypothetical protein